MLADSAGVLACCPHGGVTALSVTGTHSRILSCFRLQVLTATLSKKFQDTLMIDLQMDIIQWQTIGPHRTFSEQGLQLLLLQYREKKQRKLPKTLLSDLAWVQGKIFTLQKGVDPRVFSLKFQCWALYLYNVLLVFSRKQLTYGDYLKQTEHCRRVLLPGGRVIFKRISLPFCMSSFLLVC